MFLIIPLSAQGANISPRAESPRVDIGHENVLLSVNQIIALPSGQLHWSCLKCLNKFSLQIIYRVSWFCHSHSSIFVHHLGRTLSLIRISIFSAYISCDTWRINECPIWSRSVVMIFCNRCSRKETNCQQNCAL